MKEERRRGESDGKSALLLLPSHTFFSSPTRHSTPHPIPTMSMSFRSAVANTSVLTVRVRDGTGRRGDGARGEAWQGEQKESGGQRQRAACSACQRQGKARRLTIRPHSAKLDTIEYPVGKSTRQPRPPNPAHAPTQKKKNGGVPCVRWRPDSSPLSRLSLSLSLLTLGRPAGGPILAGGPACRGPGGGALKTSRAWGCGREREGGTGLGHRAAA